ncbi:SDR family NAD(P)-dependent oxidoreductase [Sandaracinobacter sp. RS1-74]|uniref:SDR family NAD(P)-dependent oxidoreductase n=1 Tax=Sandaracinobacteroides sayramensis TaxID=2913411 RepID=UPI001EDA814F|nr:SDR family NAD(P)-dependent oxidoreductase [Sandaracinobacteroides sayramensis]
MKIDHGKRAIAGARALVTGANGGLGVALVDTLLSRGAVQVHAAMRNIANTPDHWRGDDRIRPLIFDLTRHDLIEKAAALGPSLDLIVHNAGVTCIGPVSEKDDAQVRQTMEVNYFGPARLTRLVSEEMSHRQAGMIFVLSMAAMIPPGPAPIYSASKSACAMYAAGVLADLGKRGLEVMLAFPGYIDTPMAAAFSSFKATPAEIAENMLDSWESGKTHVFPDKFSSTVFEYMTSNGGRMLIDTENVRHEIAEYYNSWSSSQNKK